MEKSENRKFLELLAAKKGITDPEKVEDFINEMTLMLIGA